MQPPRPTDAQRRRSRVFLTVFLLAIVGLAIAAALIIQRGLADEELQQQLEELRGAGR